MTKHLNNKKQLQEEVYRLTNEIEELRLEREESKKNVLHFMQESDLIRQELKRAQEIIEELSLKEEKGYNSPPPESENDEQDHSHSSLTTKKKKVSTLFSKLSLLDEERIAALFQLLEDGTKIDTFKNELDQTKTLLSQAKSENRILKDELNQFKEEYQVTQSALRVENERADIIEIRWKESESHLEHAEYTIQSLKKELERRQEWVTTNNNLDNHLNDELCKLKESLDLTVKGYNQCKLNLEQIETELIKCKQNEDILNSKNSNLENSLKEASNQAKIRENHLKTVNKTLRDEIRKKNKVEEEIINVEYLRNVIIKFLERKNTRPQLVPVLSTLLKCTKDEQHRLNQLTSQKMVL